MSFSNTDFELSFSVLHTPNLRPCSKRASGVNSSLTPARGMDTDDGLEGLLTLHLVKTPGAGDEAPAYPGRRLD